MLTLTLNAITFMVLLCVDACLSRNFEARPSTRAPLQFVFSNTTLPNRDRGLSALYDGHDSVYLFGGQVNFQSIRKYSISRDEVQEAGNWSIGLQDGAAILDNTGNILYFGGKKNDREMADVWRVEFDHSGTGNSNTTATLIGQLPHTLTAMGAVSALDRDGTQFVYLFGGRDRTGHRDEVLRFSTVTNAVHHVGILPRPYSNTNAVFDPEHDSVYLLGGHNSLEAWTQILKFDTPTGGVSVVNASLPSRTTFSCTVWTGTEAYTIGGHDLGQANPRVRRFRPRAGEAGTGTVEEIPINGYPSRGISSHSCVYVQRLHRVYMFGGFVDHQTVSAHIMYIDLPRISTD